MSKNQQLKQTKHIEIGSSSFLFGFFVNFLKPSAYIKSVSEIDLDKLKEQGIKLIICDLDNTLVPHFTKFPTKLAVQFVEDAKSKGFEFVLLSNNTSKRVSFFAEKLGVKKFISNAKKPLPKTIRKQMEKYNYKPQETVIIGDMIITDIIASNLLNTESILVQPLVDSDVAWNKIIGWLEDKLFARLSKNNLLISSTDFKKSEILSEDYEIL